MRRLPFKCGAGPRQVAAAAVGAVGAGKKLDAVLDKYARPRLDRRDAVFAEMLAKTTIRNLRLIDFYISSVTKGRPDKLPGAVRDILRVGAAEIFFLRTPGYAAVDEAVTLVKTVGLAGFAPLVNAVLRKLSGWPGIPLPDKKDAAGLAIRYSFPDWLVSRWWARFGAPETEELLNACNQPAPLTVYVNPLRGSKEGLLEDWAAAGLKATEGPFGSLILELGDTPLAAAPGFAEGRFVILDPASALGPAVLAPPPGTVVLDLCAGFGGKTFQLAWSVGAAGSVVAVDVSPAKIAALVETASRLGVANVQTQRVDILHNELPSADYIHLDAPCSNLGVIRHKPDVKWRVTESDIAACAEKQREMLNRAARSLRRSGRLVYSVCSFEQEETAEVVANAVAADPSLTVISAEAFGRRGDPFLWTFPHRDACNGGFIALLEKR